MDAAIRKNQNILVSSGMAVMLFGLWSIIRFFLLILIDPMELQNILGDKIDDSLAEIVFFGIIGFVMLIDMLIRIYVGMAAIRLGRGGIWKRRFPIITALYAYITIHSLIVSFITANDAKEIVNSVISAVIDLTVVVALILILISTYKLKKIQAQTEKN